MNENALIIFAKAPHGGTVKTRLQGHLPDEQRLALYRKLLYGTIDRLGRIEGVDTCICYAPAGAGRYFEKFGLDLFPQAGGDIGERMFNALSDMLRKGYEKVALVGVDIPDLSGDVIVNAFGLLDNADIVFGPAADGGYYLVGMKSPVREIFRGIDWSTDVTLGQSLDVCGRHGYSVAFTEELPDVDTIEDVKKRGIGNLLR